jgi:hypothetical protein
MLRVEGDSGEHEKFRMLCARAISLDLAPLEEYELREHLHECKDCREVLLQYRSLTTEGMLTLLGDAELEAVPNWDESEARRRLLERVFADQRAAQTPNPVPVAVARRTALAWVNEKPLVRMALAACLLFAIGFGGYRLGAHKAMLGSGSAASAISRNAAPAARDARLASLGAGASPTTPAEERWLKLVEEKETAVAALSAQAKQLERMQSENAQKEQELGRLRAELRAIAEQDQQLVAANAQSGARFAALSQQRDTLLAQVQALSQTYDSQKTELASLRSEHDKAILRTSSLEYKIEELTAANREQERKVKDAEQYLTSDRDIRELMGARKLYIADVFDVDGTSRTQKPFGRVFYTQGKSLVFYAFDLDREPGVVNASTFQVWGQREAPQGEQPTPMNLGILYRDSESNRRWVMRFDEPSQLSEIDAVFVTVEPRGGSHKPTSKPFLYALLRNEANHP